jgi:hypothetical protein
VAVAEAVLIEREDAMTSLRTFAFVCICLACFGATTSRAFEVLGVGTESLLGFTEGEGDLTDLGNDGDETLYVPPDLGGFDAEFFSSDEPGFGGGEFAYNVFDNILGPRNDKWCCGTFFPQIVGADFGEKRYILTHFTVSSANDTPNRDPRVWRIEGSVDNETWTTIFSHDDPGASLWTERLQVLLFMEGEDYEVQDEAYSMFRMVTDATALTDGAFFQVGEIEFFGHEDDGGAPEFIRGDPNRDGTMNIADGVYILQNIFAQGPEIMCPDAGDANDDENVNIADAVYILQNIFAQGSPIPAPGTGACGPDPTPHPTGGPDLPPCDYCPEACATPPSACPVPAG